MRYRIDILLRIIEREHESLNLNIYNYRKPTLYIYKVIQFLNIHNNNLMKFNDALIILTNNEGTHNTQNI